MLAVVLRAFRRVDVLTAEPCRGNPVVVVLDADGLTTRQLQQFASWANLSDSAYPGVMHGELGGRAGGLVAGVISRPHPPGLALAAGCGTGEADAAR